MKNYLHLGVHVTNGNGHATHELGIDRSGDLGSLSDGSTHFNTKLSRKIIFTVKSHFYASTIIILSC